MLVAAGTGTRLGTDTPKQFRELCGQPLYYWSLMVMGRSDLIKEVVLVVPMSKVSEIRQEVLVWRLGKKIRVIGGGAVRQESVWCGLTELCNSADSGDIVVVHDAARPFLTLDVLDRVVRSAQHWGAAVACVPATDTVKIARGGKVKETLSRSGLVQAQTPQAARYDWFMQAHSRARESGHATTDDAHLLEVAGYDVQLVEGSSFNFKLTRPDDFVLAKALGQFTLLQNSLS